MLRNTYLANPEVAQFVDWLEQRVSGTHPINFNSAKPVQYINLHDALTNYIWPLRDTTINYPTGRVVLPAGSNLAANTHELNTMATQLTNALGTANDHNFAAWAQCVMDWGGVAGGGFKGNNYWISQNVNNICGMITNVNNWIALQDDDITLTPANLRFNAGMTKLYSLLGQNLNFIIYDSRVAGALAWLVQEYSNQNHLLHIPNLLAFRCMPARKTITPKIRNPNPKTDINPNGFPWMNNNHKFHLHWNQRANWILATAFQQANQNNPAIPFANLREIEASLFMIGQDLT